MKSKFKEKSRLYLQRFSEFIKDSIPALLIFYSYMPVINKQFNNITYVVTIALLLITLFLQFFKSKSRKYGLLYSLIVLVALLFSQNATVFFLYLMIAIYLMFLFKVRKVASLFIYLLDLFIFLFLLVVITSFLINIPDAIRFEDAIVAFLLVSVALYLAVYTIKISLDVLKYFSNFSSEENDEFQIVPNKKINTFLNRNFIIIIIMGVTFLLLLPDFIYAWLMYDLYFSLFPEHEFNFLNRLFYAFSNHFNIVLDKYKLIKMDYLLLSTTSGNFIKIVHVILLKLIDTIILGAIIGMLVEYLKSFANKEKTR